MSLETQWASDAVKEAENRSPRVSWKLRGIVVIDLKEKSISIVVMTREKNPEGKVQCIGVKREIHEELQWISNDE